MRRVTVGLAGFEGLQLLVRELFGRCFLLLEAPAMVEQVTWQQVAKQGEDQQAQVDLMEEDGGVQAWG